MRANGLPEAKSDWEGGLIEFENRIEDLEKELAAAHEKLRVHEISSRTKGIDLMASLQKEKRSSADEEARKKEIEQLKARVQELVDELAQTREMLSAKEVAMDELSSRLRKAEKELKMVRQLAVAEAKQQAMALAEQHEEALAQKDREMASLRQSSRLIALRWVGTSRRLWGVYCRILGEKCPRRSGSPPSNS